MRTLVYDPTRWSICPTLPQNTLQVFITDQCNLRCKGCFYIDKLGKNRISFDKYQQIIHQYKTQVNKITLLGGEPTLHKNFYDMLAFNKKQKLQTTVYTNGTKQIVLDKSMACWVSLRIGVHGVRNCDKALEDLKPPTTPFTLVYMLNQANKKDLFEAAERAEHLGASQFYISSIRDIAQTKSFYKDTKDTISNEEYAEIVQTFVLKYKGGMNRLHLSTRGVFAAQEVKCCRFLNLYQDGSQTICPLDISLNKKDAPQNFNTRECNKAKRCVLQKIVLVRN